MASYRIPRIPALFLILILSAAFAAFSQGPGPVAPRIHPVTGAKLHRIQPGLELDAVTGRIYLDAKVCLDTGVLEFLLVQGKKKSYESLFSTEVKPSDFMTAALLLRWQQGDPIRIVLLSGKDTVPLEKYLRNRDTASAAVASAKKASAPMRWRLSGSNYWDKNKSKTKDGFWADQEGIHIAVVERAEALIHLDGDLKNPYSNSAFGYDVNPAKPGRLEAPVTLIFSKEAL
jgi:hypothetical protein